MTKWLAGLAGVAGLTAALVLPAVQAVLPDTDTAGSVAHVALSADGDKGEDRGQGPPPWANNDHDKSGAKAKGKNDAWKRLSPQARADLMPKLVEQHQQGMKKFAACKEAVRDGCEKPLPPGLAKKL